MRVPMVILTALMAASSIVAEAQSQRHLSEVTVTARRPLKEIGMVKTTIDSAALHENVSLSMADILTYNSSIYVKNYGRGTEATVAFRGTSAGHTKVTWNGMRVNSPTLGMTDFSTIPSFLVDRAGVFHGSSSVGSTGGGLGGLVALDTAPLDAEPGLEAQYVQGIGSFGTWDEAARLSWNNDNWQSTTRFVASSSDNDFTYTNYDKKENIYDGDHNIVGQYHPRERNRNGAWRDLHVMQEVYYDTRRGDRAGIAAWWMSANRELPLLSTDYGDAAAVENRNREETFRGVASWKHRRSKWRTDLRGGVTHTWSAYDYARALFGTDLLTPMTTSRTHVTTLFAQGMGEYNPLSRLFFSVDVAFYQHFVTSLDRNVTTADGSTTRLGYKEARIETSASVNARWQATDRLGVAAVLRHEVMGTKSAPLIPALFVDFVAWRPLNLVVKGSVSRNYRFPTLNDLYSKPGGNPDLRSENGFSYDLAASIATGGKGWSLSGSAGWFDSYIDDWIMWLPTPKGYYTPRNVREVHAYGIELNANLMAEPWRDWFLDLNGSYSWTPSVNRGEKMTDADLSVGRQLPYVPRSSASATGRVAHGRWGFLYKWNFYSRRYTMTSNDVSLSGSLPAYFMSNIALDYTLPVRRLSFQFKVAVNNLLNEKYLSVLSRPMPGINFEFYVAIKFVNR